MPTIIFIEPDGQHRQVQAQTGLSVMKAAVENDVRGIDADCGGSCACATCHGYVDPTWQSRVPPPDQVESDMLDFAHMRSDGSRLTCQIVVTEAIDGLIVRLPQSQG